MVLIGTALPWPSSLNSTTPPDKARRLLLGEPEACWCHTSLCVTLASVGEKWLETHVRSHIAFACARVLRAEIRFVVRVSSGAVSSGAVPTQWPPVTPLFTISVGKAGDLRVPWPLPPPCSARFQLLCSPLLHPTTPVF